MHSSATVLIAMAGLTLAAAAPIAPAQAKVPKDFVGIVAEDVFAADPGYRDAHLSAQRSGGIGLTRHTFRWSAIETAPGQYDFSHYDAYVASLARHGMRLLPILFDPPQFRSSGPPGRSPREGTYPPQRYEDMGDFAAVLIGRYGPRGSFWAEHPEVPHMPIRAWQVWNEPNLKYYWPTGPSPRAYTKLLKATAAGIKRADPRAEVVTAGLPDSNKGVSLSKFLDRMYRAGAKRYFDTLAINPYAESHRALIKKLELVRRVTRKRRDGKVRLWITELGWATGGPRGRFTVGKGRQAKLIGKTLRELARKRRKLGIRGVVYFNWRDAPPYDGRSDFWGLHTGLLDINGNPKPGLSSFVKALRSLR